MGEVIKKFPRGLFLELISDGLLESEALIEINRDLPEKNWFQKATMIQLQVKDPDFKEALEAAKKARADNWYEGIARSVKDDICKDEVPAAKLRFEQRKYLAAIDNPDKYAEKSKREVDINVNIFQEMKELPAAEARKLMANIDPFNIIDAVYEEVEDEEQKCAAAQISAEEIEEDIFS
jgi:hypothetical protein